MKRLFSRLFDTTARTQKPGCPLTQKHRARLCVEGLEDRTALSAGYYWSLSKVTVDPSYTEYGGASQTTFSKDHYVYDIQGTRYDGTPFHIHDEESYSPMPAIITPRQGIQLHLTLNSNHQDLNAFNGGPATTQYVKGCDGQMGWWGWQGINVVNSRKVVGDTGDYQITLGSPSPDAQKLRIAETGTLYEYVRVGGEPPKAPKPDAVTLTATPKDDHNINLCWTGGAGATNFLVYSGDTKVTSLSSAKTSFTVPNLKPGTQYTYTIKAINSAGTTPSKPKSATTLQGEVKVDSIKESDTQENTIEVHYHIDNYDVGKPFDINVYRARNAEYSRNYDSDSLITLGTQTMSGDKLKKGNDYVTTFQINPQKGVGLGIDGHHPFVLAVADPENKTKEVNTAYREEEFEIRTIGVVSEGFSLGNPLHSNLEPWVAEMANTLQTTDGYNRAIPFAWHSSWIGPNSVTADSAGHELYQEVARVIGSLKNPSHPNEVFNFHFIGHSRGSVVISRAVEDLILNKALLGLKHPYIKMTFLDPHPANNLYGTNADGLGSWKGVSISYAGLEINYSKFQEDTQDGSVNAPAGVDEVEHYFQKTCSARYPVFHMESVLNLWGLSSQFVHSQAKTPVKTYNMTDKQMKTIDDKITYIGHSEVHDWYFLNVVKNNKVTTGSKISI